jgi:hypothetical protein
MFSLLDREVCGYIRWYSHWIGARGSVVGWGTMLQGGRSPIRIPDKVDFFNLPNPSSRTMALGSTQPLDRNEYQESSWGVKSGRRVGLTTLPPSVSRMSENVGASTSRNPKGLHGLYGDNFTFTLPSLNHGEGGCASSDTIIGLWYGWMCC